MCCPAWLLLLLVASSTLISSSMGAPQANDTPQGNDSGDGDPQGTDIEDDATQETQWETREWDDESFHEELIRVINDPKAKGKVRALKNIDPEFWFRHHARQGNLEEVMKYLNETSIHVNIQDARNWTALIWACRYGHEHVVEFLLDEGAKVNMQNWRGDTALIWAVGGGFTSIVEMLMKAGADPNIPEYMGLTPVSVAAAMGREEELRLMDKYAFIDLNHQDVKGRTPLNLAARVGQAKMVQLLGYYGNIDIADEFAMAAVHWSVNLVDTSTLLAALALCPDLSLVDDKGNTPLEIAIFVGNVEGEKLIMEHMSNPAGGCWLGDEEFAAEDYTFFDCKQIQCKCRGWWRHTGVLDPNCFKRQVNVFSKQELENSEYHNETTTSTPSITT